MKLDRTMKARVASPLSVSLLLAVLPGAAVASGFALIDQNSSGLGNAYAGATAGAEDASTVFFNPAGMSRMGGSQFVLAGNFVSGSQQFTNTGSQAAAGGRALGSAPENARRSAFIPSGYFMTEINPRWRFGIGVNSPFGSKTEYSADWIGRYQAIKSSIESLNVNPSVSWQASDTLSLGAGLDYQRIKATLTNAAVIAGAIDGLTTMDGNDAGWGYNFGVLLKLEDGARIGFAYRSSISYRLSGTAYTASALTVPGVTNTVIPVNAQLTVPDTWSFGYFKPLNDKWDVMADAARTRWSHFNELRVTHANTGATLALTPENWRDTWRFGLGANYHFSEQWMGRMGLAHDVDPVPEGFRTARIPDSDRTWLSLGGQYKAGKDSVLDFGYAHLFIKNEPINKNSGGANVSSTALYAKLSGNFSSSADILGVQYTHGF